jgi:hypothetical protein
MIFELTMKILFLSLKATATVNVPVPVDRLVRSKNPNPQKNSDSGPGVSKIQLKFLYRITNQHLKEKKKSNILENILFCRSMA